MAALVVALLSDLQLRSSGLGLGFRAQGLTTKLVTKLGNLAIYHMSHSQDSLKGGYIMDYSGEYYRGV